MTSLQKKIARLVTMHGPIDVSQYMHLAMADPDYGYYKTAQPFGREGDFITAPETSQMFGEMIAVWAIAAWQSMGHPQPFLLCEAGPGRGTLMDDILRTIGKLAPHCAASAHVALVETSPRLTRQQKQKLRRHGTRLQWVEHFAQLPPMPLVLIANELFDVLPIHQYVAAGGRFYERMVALSPEGQLCFTRGVSPAQLARLPVAAGTLADGTVIEISPAREALSGEISTHLAKQRGAALIIDYGALEPATGDTLQAMSRHSFRNPLENPGGYDLTSHVDFAALARAAHRAGCHSAAMTQGDFLLRLGLLERAGRLGADRDDTMRQQIVADVERLAGPDQMGELFKVLCIADPATTMPPFAWA